MSDIVYMVSDGAYSDYRVLGIYSTKEKAEHAKKVFKAEWLDEMTLDEVPDTPPGLFRHSVEMDREGNVEDCFIVSSVDSFPWQWRPNRFRYSDGIHRGNDTVTFYVWAEDETHAVKVANEHRVGLILSGEWTTDWNQWINKRGVPNERQH